MFLVEAHLTFGVGGGGCLLVRTLAVEFVLDLRQWVFHDLMRGHPNTLMTGLIVRMDQQL